MAKSPAKTSSGTTQGQVTNKGVPLVFLLGIAVLILIAVLGLNAALSQHSESVNSGWSINFFWLSMICFTGAILLTRHKRGGSGTASLVGALLLLVWWLGPNNVESVGKTAGASLAGAPAPIPAPLSDEDQVAQVKKAQQDAEIAATQAVAMATAQAKIDDLLQREEEIRKNLLPSVKVVACNEALTDWSETVVIPGDWHVKADWGGKHMKTQILLDGVWTLQTTLQMNGYISAVRYCTTSEANLSLREGIMALTWTID